MAHDFLFQSSLKHFILLGDLKNQKTAEHQQQQHQQQQQQLQEQQQQ